MAAREIGELSLPDALAFGLLLADLTRSVCPRAAARWHGRFVLAPPGIGLADSNLALAALAALPGPSGETAAKTLRQLANAYGLGAVAQTLRSAPRVA